MSQTLQEKNKALLLEGFEVLFNQRDFAGAEIQPEATREESKSKLPMFGDSFPR